jgi:IS5 family transposase
MAYLGEHCMKLSEGTIVDATIIPAAESTKNKQRQRDPAMHQTRKGKQWYSGNCSCVASTPASLPSSA